MFQCEWCDKQITTYNKLKQHYTSSKVCLKIKEKIEQKTKEFADDMIAIEELYEINENTIQYYIKENYKLLNSLETYEDKLKEYEMNCNIKNENFMIDIIKLSRTHFNPYTHQLQDGTV